jgi:hypothetical protein
MQSMPLEFQSSAKVKWRKKFDEDTARLLKERYFSNALKSLSDAGANREWVISLLYYSLPTKQSSKGLLELKRRAKSLRVLALGLKQNASTLEAYYSSPLWFAEFWKRMILSGDSGSVRPSEELKLVPKTLIGEMRSFAKSLDEEADRFIECSRLSGRASDDYFVRELMRHVFETTSKYRYETLAGLLQFVHKLLGSKREFSSEQLKQIRKRRLGPVAQREIPARSAHKGGQSKGSNM